MALSGGGGSGAGFGFVGATFGQTDLVSPYLQMQEQAEQAPPKFKADPIALNAISAIDNDVLGVLVERHSKNEVFRSPQHMSAKKDGIDFTNREEAEFFQNSIKEEKAQRGAMLNLKEISDLSYNTVTSKSSEILSTDSPLNNSHNQRKLNRYSQANAIKNIGISRAGDGIDFIPKGNNVYMFIDKDFIKDGDDEDALDVKDFLIEYKDDLRIEEDKDGNLFVNMLSGAFHLNDGDFIELNSWADLARNVNLPIMTTVTGKETDDGFYFEDEQRQRVDIGRLRFRVAQDALANDKNFVLDGSNYELTGERIQLTNAVAEGAKRRGYSVDDQNFVNNEDARNVIEDLVEMSASEQSFKRVDKRKSLPDGSGDGFAKYNPQGMADANNNPVMTISGAPSVDKKGDYVIYDASKDEYKSPTSPKNVRAAVSITAKNVLTSIEGLARATVAPSRIMVDDNGEVYLKAITKRDNYDGIFDNTQHAEFLSELTDAGLLESQSDTETRWIKLTAQNAENLAANLELSPRQGQTSKELLAEFIPTVDPLFNKRQQLRGGAETQKPSPATQQTAPPTGGVNQELQQGNVR